MTGQQEDFRTPAGAGDGPAEPLFDERSAQKAAPVVPLEEVSRRSRFATWAAGGWRDTARSPQFQRSWPLGLLLVATLAAAAAVMNTRRNDAAAQAVSPTTGAATVAGTNATADAQNMAAPQASDEPENSREARDTRRESASDAARDAVLPGNMETFAAPAIGGFPGDGQRDAAARDERSGERDKGKRQKHLKRRQGARRGGAILFDVIR